MGRDISIEADQFARTLEDMFGEVTTGIKEASVIAVKDACKKGVKTVEEKIDESGIKPRSGDYHKSWSFKTKSEKNANYGEIGSKKPGLPHLLEKGHATLGGGRVPGYPHLEPASVEIFDDFEQKVEEALEVVLGS